MAVPMFSIIVPVYKAEAYIEECIDSILMQDFTDFELILADDGSPDRCGEIIDSYAAKDRRIKVIHQPNAGVARARNAALKLANGKYIVNVDADDYILPGMFKCLDEYISIYQADVYLFGFLIRQDKTLIKNIPDIQPGIYAGAEKKGELYKKIVYDKTKPFFTFGVYPSLAARIVKRELFEKFSFDIDESIEIGEDFAVTLPIMLNAERIYFIGQPMYVYRMVENSASHKFNIDTMHFFALMLKGFEKNGIDNRYELKNQLGAYAVYVLFNYLYSYIGSGIAYDEYIKAIKKIDRIVFDYIRCCKYNFKDLRAVLMMSLIKFKMWNVLWVYAKKRRLKRR